MFGMHREAIHLILALGFRILFLWEIGAEGHRVYPRI